VARLGDVSHSTRVETREVGPVSVLYCRGCSFKSKRRGRNSVSTARRAAEMCGEQRVLTFLQQV
jgi:hypothetical protein